MYIYYALDPTCSFNNAFVCFALFFGQESNPDVENWPISNTILRSILHKEANANGVDALCKWQADWVNDIGKLPRNCWIENINAVVDTMGLSDPLVRRKLGFSLLFVIEGVTNHVVDNSSGTRDFVAVWLSGTCRW